MTKIYWIIMIDIYGNERKYLNYDYSLYFLQYEDKYSKYIFILIYRLLYNLTRLIFWVRKKVIISLYWFSIILIFS